MPQGKPNREYTGEFKVKVIEHMLKEHLGHKETGRMFEIDAAQVRRWERTYLEEGAEGLKKDHRGKSSPGKPPKLNEKVESDLIAENQRLRMENDYLKKLNALVQERQLRERKPK